ncbi:MAG: Glu-tRNA(Gln) amidotransferase subunit GatD [Nanoarchaeota archaeon]
MATPGDTIRVTTKDNDSIEGLLLPVSQEGMLLIKLDSGYNIGVKQDDVRRIAVLEKAEEKRAGEKKLFPGEKASENGAVPAKTSSTKTIPAKTLPTITILHTGGTIASRVDYRTGGVHTAFSPEDLVQMFPELKELANIDSELIAQMWSDDLRFGHFSSIAKKIEQHIRKGTRGIIIGMGTDNLAVGAAALAFIVEKTPIPIILVGAQRSSDRGSSDAAMNLLCTAEFIAKTDFAGVAICMHEWSSDKSCAILPATKTYKLHSSRRDAFKAVNAEAIARIDYETKKIEFLQKNYPKRGTVPPVFKPKMEDKVGLLKIHVNMFPEQFEFFAGYKGLVIEGTGLGHTPGQIPNPECEIHRKIYPAIKKVIDSGCVVVMTTQCLFGGVNMNVYDKGRDLLNLGVIPGKDMLANTALVKLSWLLANYPKNEVRNLIGQNLRGEINEQLEYKEDVLG